MVLCPKKKAGEEDSDNNRLFHFRVDFSKPLQLDTAYLLSEMLAQTIERGSQIGWSLDLSSNSCEKCIRDIHNINICNSYERSCLWFLNFRWS